MNVTKLSGKRTVGRHTFELVDGRYECRGAAYYDDDHDQIPEPSLRAAATILQASLKADGINTQIEWGEKGWIEVYIEE